MRTRVAIGFVTVVVLAGCASGHTTQQPENTRHPTVSRAHAFREVRGILGARPVWLHLAWVGGYGSTHNLAWLGYSPLGNPPDRECLRPPCTHRPSPVAAFVDARGSGFDGWADVRPAGTTATPGEVVRVMARHETIRLARSETPRSSASADIHAARASDAQLFAIFPRLPGEKSCAIPTGAGVRGSTIAGTCRTAVTYPNEHGRYRLADVRFRESWGDGHSSSWTLIVQLPAEKVVATQLHGEPSPQMRYIATDAVRSRLTRPQAVSRLGGMLGAKPLHVQLVWADERLTDVVLEWTGYTAHARITPIGGPVGKKAEIKPYRGPAQAWLAADGGPPMGVASVRHRHRTHRYAPLPRSYSISVSLVETLRRNGIRVRLAPLRPKPAVSRARALRTIEPDMRRERVAPRRIWLVLVRHNARTWLAWMAIGHGRGRARSCPPDSHGCPPVIRGPAVELLNATSGNGMMVTGFKG